MTKNENEPFITPRAEQAIRQAGVTWDKMRELETSADMGGLIVTKELSD